MQSSRFLQRLEPRLMFAADWQNPLMPEDVNDSGIVSPIDALLVINRLDLSDASLLPDRSADSDEPYYDVNGDMRVSPIDAILVINALLTAQQPLTIVGGISPKSDPNGNGVVLEANIMLSGQSLPHVEIDVEFVGATEGLAGHVTADGNGNFSVLVSVDTGRHAIRLTARDTFGRTASSEIVIRHGDVLQDWNAAALNVVREWSALSNDPYVGRIVPSQPPRVARNLAMIHTAMFDAVNSVERMYQPHLAQLDSVGHVLPAVAAAAAAHQVASRLYAEADEKAIWDASLAEALSMAPANIDVSPSLTLGRAIGDIILSARADDGASVTASYVPGIEPGDWNRTTPGFLPALLPQWPQVRPFALDRGDQFRPEPPPSLESAEYALAVDQVLRLGGYLSTERTAEQTEIARFWADGAGTFTPPGHWNQIASDVALAHKSSLSENARMFALLNIALADAGIASWDAKYTYDLWRPIDAIRKADLDGNAATDADPSWMPLINTPPFPTYTSGHSTFSGAAAAVLSSLFGDNVSFSSELDGQLAASQRPLDPRLIVTRTFTSFSEAAEEAGLSRIYGGIHFSFDSTAGHDVGHAVGRLVVDRFLLPLPLLENGG